MTSSLILGKGMQLPLDRKQALNNISTKGSLSFIERKKYFVP